MKQTEVKRQFAQLRKRKNKVIANKVVICQGLAIWICVLPCGAEAFKPQLPHLQNRFNIIDPTGLLGGLNEKLQEVVGTVSGSL